jgi:predicted nucleotidyltransferase
MEQNLDFEILDALSMKGFHARALAERLKTNHMTVLRRLKNLMSENVLDCRNEGRNKTYLLKKSIEARNKIIMAELYKLNKILKEHGELRNIVTKVQCNPEIRLAILFGSYVKGTADKDSDIDLYIETKNRILKKQLERLNSRLSIKIGEYDRSSLLIKEMEKDHVIIKGVELYYEKNGFFDQIT